MKMERATKLLVVCDKISVLLSIGEARDRAQKQNTGVGNEMHVFPDKEASTQL
jgi:hypothetical protein